MYEKLKAVFSFPNPVNDIAARVVAAMVVVLTLSIIIIGDGWLIIVLTYGFLARVATGPTLSPIGQLATRVIAPRISSTPRLVPGPPKRFAQAIGLAFAVSALVAHYVLGLPVAARVFLGVLALFASIEAFVGFCMGCYVFNWLMRVGLVPQSVCEACASLDYNSN